MPLDIALTWDTQLQGGKISFLANDLVMSESLLTAVIISLFSDARAANDAPLPDPRSEDRRGWWGDSTNTSKPNDSVGSKLWLLEREKNVDSVLKKAKMYVEEALQWMLDEGVAASINVTVEAQPSRNTGAVVLAFQVNIAKPKIVDPVAFKFEQEWRATANGIQ